VTRAIAILVLACSACAAQPELGSSAVESAADHSSGRVAPGEIVVLHPANAGPAVLFGAQLDTHGIVATLLAETRVWFDGIPAPLAYSVSGDVMAIVPYEIANHGATEVVVEYQGRRSPPVTLEVAESAPALFTLDSTGRGQAAMLNETGCCNSARDPAARGSIAVLYATGEGQTVPPGITGSVTIHARIADYPVPQLPVRVTVGGQPAEIVYAGDAPNAVAGLFQVNFRVPANAPIGDAVPLVLSIGGASSPGGVTMAVRSQVKRILVADPDPIARNRLKQILTGAGYEVSTEPKGEPFDLAIVSLAVPEQERQDTIRALRSSGARFSIIAIATAAVAGPATLRAADLFGAQAVFTKPMASQAVLQRVRELLQARPTPYVDGLDTDHPIW